jgi:hypothetical protein
MQSRRTGKRMVSTSTYNQQQKSKAIVIKWKQCTNMNIKNRRHLLKTIVTQTADQHTV